MPDALLLIDIQDGFRLPEYLSFWGPARNNPALEQNLSSLLSSYRSLVASSPAQHKAIHVIHSSAYSPLKPDGPGFAIQSIVTPLPSEPVMVKYVNSAFIGTQLETVLREHFAGKAGKLYIVGLTTDHCVSTSTRMAANLKICDGDDGEGEVVLIEDGTATFGKGEFSAELVHAVHIESLRGEFARISSTEEVLKAWKGLNA